LKTGFYAFCLLAIMLSSASLAAPKKNPPKQTKVIAVIETNKGIIKFELFEKDMPITTKNFIELAQKKFYDGLNFHRVVPNFVIQGGAPKGNGTADKSIKLEINPNVKWDAAGMVGMARTPDPDSATSQFFISLGPTPNLNKSERSDGYALFGKVTVGIDVVKKIEVGDVMKKVYVVRVPVK